VPGERVHLDSDDLRLTLFGERGRGEVRVVGGHRSNGRVPIGRLTTNWFRGGRTQCKLKIGRPKEIKTQVREGRGEVEKRRTVPNELAVGNERRRAGSLKERQRGSPRLSREEGRRR